MTADVRVERIGQVGRISLDRPRAIHALTVEMCQAINAALLEWRDDPGVQLVLIDHHEGRGFCAGGDVRRVAIEGEPSARAFFMAEYQMNHLLFTYPKPIIAFMDGITMGGGVGLSQPCRYRVATENTLLAMPETKIGLFPDVGGGWYLSRLPDNIGRYLALTSAQINGADCLSLGVASHYIASDQLASVKEQLITAPERVEAILKSAVIAPPSAPIEAYRAQISQLFSADTLEAILAALHADPSAWAKAQYEAVAEKSPLSCKISLRLIEQGRLQTDFTNEMRVEYDLVIRVTQQPDFAEGVRALLIDKDNSPQWAHVSAADVDDALVDTVFQPLPDQERWQPLV